MSQRTLHIIDSLEPTGVARQLLWLAQGLAGQGVEVHVCALGRGGLLVDEFRAAGIDVAVLGRRWRVDPVAYRRLARLVAALRPNVVHTWDPMSGVYGRLAARAAGGSPRSSSVGGVSDADSAQPAETERPHPSPLPKGEGTGPEGEGTGRPVVVVGVPRIDPWRGPLGWTIERRLAPLADRFVLPHGAVRDWCAGHGLPEERLKTVPGGVPPARESDVARDQLLAELGLPADARLIGVVERLLPERRVKDLIWAADLLRVLHDNLRLVVIGDGPERPQLERFARLASDLEHIHFLGERTDVWRIRPHLDAFWTDDPQAGCAAAVMEAMAAGVPVVASDVPGHRRLITHDETGFLVPVAGRADRSRATDRLLADGELAARIGAAARQHVLSRFGIGQFVRRYSELYARLSG